MYRSAFVKRVLEIFIGFYENLRDFYGNLRVYKKLVRKIFLTRCLVLRSLPPLKVTRLDYIGNRYIGRRVFPADRDFHKPTVANATIVANITFLPNLFHNFYYFQSHPKLSVRSHQTYNIQPCHLSFYHSSLPTHQSRYFHHQNPLYES